MNSRSVGIGDAPPPQAGVEAFSERCLAQARAVGPQADDVGLASCPDAKPDLQLRVENIQVASRLLHSAVLAEQIEDRGSVVAGESFELHAAVAASLWVREME